MHPLLVRQLTKCFGATDAPNPEFRRFCEMIDGAYTQSDADRALIERSMELSSRELTARHEEIARAELKYRAIFENVTEGIFQISPAGRFMSVNPAMAGIFGYCSPEQMQNELTDVAHDFYADPRRYDEIRGEISRHGSIKYWESQARRRDGQLIWISETTRRVNDEEGNFKYMEGTLRDITVRKAAEAEREALQSKLVGISRQAGMAEIATGVLHNVGNVLNSINVSASVAAERLRSSRLSGLSKIATLFQEHKSDLAVFLADGDKAHQISDYVCKLADHLSVEQRDILHEIHSLMQNIEHVKQIVKSQQNYARSSGIQEAVSLAEIVEDAIRINQESLERHRVTIVREINTLPPLKIDKHQVLQIMVNLISNAKHAMRCCAGDRVLTVRAGALTADPSRLIFEVRDTGTGISTENLTRIFSHGFTTRTDGHGFGLHTSALAAKNMGGSLTAKSEGLGMGAIFILDIPLVVAVQSDQTWRAA